MPRNPEIRAGLGNRRQSPISAHKPAAESVSMPLKQRSRAICGAWLQAGTCCSSSANIDARRPLSSSTAAR